MTREKIISEMAMGVASVAAHYTDFKVDKEALAAVLSAFMPQELTQSEDHRLYSEEYRAYVNTQS